MRCPDCQVDLNENVSRCPLCGRTAEDIAPVIEGVTYQDYPDCDPAQPAPTKKPGREDDREHLPFMEKLRAKFHF